MRTCLLVYAMAGWVVVLASCSSSPTRSRSSIGASLRGNSVEGSDVEGSAPAAPAATEEKGPAIQFVYYASKQGKFGHIVGRTPESTPKKVTTYLLLHTPGWRARGRKASEGPVSSAESAHPKEIPHEFAEYLMKYWEEAGIGSLVTSAHPPPEPEILHGKQGGKLIGYNSDGCARFVLSKNCQTADQREIFSHLELSFVEVFRQARSVEVDVQKSPYSRADWFDALRASLKHDKQESSAPPEPQPSPDTAPAQK